MAPRIKFDELITIEDWSGALGRILDAAAKATQDENAEGRQASMDLLLMFIKRSPAKVEVLDVIARKAIDDLSVAEIAASLDRIAARQAELMRAAGLIDAVAEDAKKDARILQMEATLDALAKAKLAIEALTRLEGALVDPDVRMLEKLRAAGEEIAGAAKALRV
jgi:hypothetical protein